MSSKTVSRRDFLKVAGVTLGAATLACSAPALTDGPEDGPLCQPEIHLGDQNMSNNKILVTYASRLGSTVGVAEAIGKTLAENGAQVDVLCMQDVKDLTSYRAVVAGSAIRDNEWLPEAMDFLKANRTELSHKPFAAFLVCMTLAMPKADQFRQGVSDWLKPVRALVKPVSEGLFAGTLDTSKISSWRIRTMFKVSVAMGVWSEGDHRDWKAIRLWAESLPAVLH
jgi:menaquinone-dependent protoporphyrinogen oxidase